MSVDESIDAYMDFSRALFKPKWLKFNAFIRPRPQLPMTKDRMERILRRTSSISTALDDSMQDVDSPCKV